jgi:hypothetical protein
VVDRGRRKGVVVFRSAKLALLTALVSVTGLLGLCGCGGKKVAGPSSSTVSPSALLLLDAFYTPPASFPAVPGALVRSEALIGRVLPPGSRA